MPGQNHRGNERYYTIDDDVKAQQGIPFQYFPSESQTYLGKRFLLEYWSKRIYRRKNTAVPLIKDTEAYCIPFYMAKISKGYLRNLLTIATINWTKQLKTLGN